MNDAEELQALLLSFRNADGGWPSRRGRSWTEPTALALLALQGTHVSVKTRTVTAAWLANRQSPDGGWPPCAVVPTSTWVTSLASLALAQESEHSQGCPRGALWLSGHVYPELNAFQGFMQHRLGISPSQAPGSSSWFPGTAGWVIPTAFSILALSCWSARLRSPSFQQAIQRGQTYLLSRRCSDGGWNHGGSPQRSETAPSYAETTGLALVALANSSSPMPGPTLRLAQGLLERPDSTEGLCWLLMGLAAHGVRNEEPQWTIRPKTTQDVALHLITLQTLRGRNPFLQPAL
jgi:hypothetical protein